MAPEKVAQALAVMWRAGIAHGARVIAMTTMEAPYSDPTIPATDTAAKAYEAQRLQLNQLMQREAGAAEFEGRLLLLDLARALPQWGLSPEERGRYWDDGLHLTPAGYDWMAQILADVLLKQLASR